MSYTITIADWIPPSVNQLLGLHWATRGRIKKQGEEMVAVHWHASGYPRATTKRRVTVTLALPARLQNQRPDGDNVMKVLLDGLVKSGALKDDGPDWCELATVRHEIRPAKVTVIELEDLP